jgi:hypothetical protein
MKWIEISKAKVKFGQEYLIASNDLEKACTGSLEKSETTAAGIVHTFSATTISGYKPVKATHVALISDPTNE